MRHSYFRGRIVCIFLKVASHSALVSCIYMYVCNTSYIYIKLGLSQVSRLSKVFLFQRCPLANVVSIGEGTHLWVTHKNQFLTTKPEGEDQQSIRVNPHLRMIAHQWLHTFIVGTISIRYVMLM